MLYTILFSSFLFRVLFHSGKWKKFQNLKKIKCETSTYNTFLNVLQLPYLKAKKGGRQREGEKEREEKILRTWEILEKVFFIP